MAFSLGEYQDIFLEEADEQLQELNQNLLELEKNPEDEEIINNIFRAAHSFKSSAAFVGLNDLSDLAHKMENLLQGIRDKTLKISTNIVDLIFKCFDEINSVIDTVASGEEPTEDLTWLIDEIAEITNSTSKKDSISSQELSKEKSSEEKVDVSVKKKSANVFITGEDNDRITEIVNQQMIPFELTIYISNDAQMKWVKAQLVLSSLERNCVVVKTIPSPEDLADDDNITIFSVILGTDKNIDDLAKLCAIDLIEKVDIREVSISEESGIFKINYISENLIVFEDTPVAVTKIKKEAPSQNLEDEISSSVHEDVLESESEPHHERKKVPALRTVKVSVEKLDQLLNNVGELVIANSGFYKLYEGIKKSNVEKGFGNEFKNRMEQMARIAKDLQTGIMKTRMVPIGQVFSRFNRPVRDLAKDHNKKVELVIKGEDTELDKKVIDVIGEPLLHLIRNAVDHGIESPEERIASGKSEMAHVTLNAYQGGNQIFVQISDDGRGLDKEIIKKVVVERELESIDNLAAMSDDEIYSFIFAPGFSTAKEITDISGRGVGMNVVRETVNELNGSISIETEKGMGTQFVLTFPLTLAIIPAIMVKVQQEMYAIPLSDVIDTTKISSSDITTIEGHEVVNYRGEILSLLRLNKFVKIRSALGEDDKIPVVTVGFGNRKIGLIVDSLEGKLEIVIKSLEQNFKVVKGLAGASILGDGSICLIVDVASMINQVIDQEDKEVDYEDDFYAEYGLSLEKNDKKDSSVEIEEKEEKDKEPALVASVKDVELESSESQESSADLETSSLLNETVQEEQNEPSVLFTEDKIGQVIETDSPDETVVLNENEVISQSETVMDNSLETEKVSNSVEDEVFEDETTPVATLMEENSGNQVDVDKKVHDALQDFKNELKSNIESTLTSSNSDDDIGSFLDISKESIKEFQVVANIGAANAAESLSKILGKNIGLSIPEVSLKLVEKIPAYIGDVNNVYIGVLMPMLGDAKGTLLFILDQDVGFDLIGNLYGTSYEGKKVLDEDGESALKELTNIVGSSVFNVFAEKTNLAIKPDVPTIVHDYLQSIIDSILVMHNLSNDYAIIMDTAFYFEDDRIVGNLMLLPDSDSLKVMVERLSENV